MKQKAFARIIAKNHAAAAVLADFPAAGRSDEQVSKEPRVNGVGPAIFDNSACLPPHADPATVGRAIPAVAQSKRVLVVDDDPAILRAVSRELRVAGWRVNSREVIARPDQIEDPDTGRYLLVDVALIDFDPHGPATIKNCIDAGVPYVIMTGDSFCADRMRAYGETVIDKPWASGELDAALREATADTEFMQHRLFAAMCGEVSHG